MPKVKRLVTPNPTDSDHEEESQETAEDAAELTPAEQQILDVCTELEGTGAKVLIKRRPPKGIKFELVSRLGVDDFAEQGIMAIAETFGGGTYQLSFQDERGIYRKNVTIEIDHRIKGTIETATVPATLASNGEAKSVELLAQKLTEKDTGQTGLFLQMMQMQREHQAQMMTLLSTMLKPAPQVSVFSELTKLAPLIGPVMDFFKSTRSGTKETLELLNTAKNIVGGDGGGGGESGLVSQVVSALAPAVLAKIGQATPAALPAPGAVTVAPEPAPSPAVASGAAQPVKQLPESTEAVDLEKLSPEMLRYMVLKGLRDAYPQLAGRAAAKMPVKTFYDNWSWELENSYPQPAIDCMVDILSAPDWIQTVFGAPSIQDQVWFEELRALFLADFGPATGDAPADLEASPQTASVDPEASAPAVSPAAASAAAIPGPEPKPSPKPKARTQQRA